MGDDFLDTLRGSLQRMQKSTTITLLFLAMTLTAALAACSPTPAVKAPTAASVATPTIITHGEIIRLTDGLTHTITLSGPAQRIISLAPSNTEILFAIGAGAQVVGRDQLSDYPDACLNLPQVGGNMGQFNLEAMVALKPDLILASELTPADQIQTIQNLGLTVFYLANPKDMDGMFANLEIVGRLSGHLNDAQKLVARLRDRVDAVNIRLAKVQQRPLVFYEIDGSDPNAPWTPGPGTFVDTLLTQAGGFNLGHDLKSSWVQISIEALIARDPDVILLGDAKWGGMTPDKVRARSGWGGLRAIRENRLYPFDDNLVSRPGPRLVDGLEGLARRLHPEAFQ
jgi:iron complex transport system substrate-binding protein